MSTETKIEDFGRKIGGARKDLRGNFRRDDIDGMTHGERIKLVRKDMVWPTPDYAKMVADGGYTKEGAALVKQLRDAFPPAPIASTRFLDTDPRYETAVAEACAQYVAVLNAAKAIAAKGKTPKELATAAQEDPQAAELICEVSAHSYFNAGVYRDSKSFTPRMDAWESHPWKVRIRMSDAISHYFDGSFERQTRRLLAKNPNWPNGTSQAEAWVRRRIWGVAPGKDGRWEISVGGRPSSQWDATDLSYYQRRTTAPITALFDQNWATQEEAYAALVAAAEAVLAAKRNEAKGRRDVLLARVKGEGVADQYRQGTQWRAGERPAAGNDYLQDFCVRGGEFGIWVNQEQRQQVLDRGYDGFCDLAELNSWPREAVSLGGTLAIAFGARGRGGQQPAAAHYEAALRVINLTKPHGEGSLAHEFGHAVDHHLGERAYKLGIVDQVTSLDKSGGRFLSDCSLRAHYPSREMSPEEQFIREMRAAMEEVWTKTSLPDRATRLEQVRQAHTRNVEAFRYQTKQAMDYVIRDLPRLYPDWTAEKREKVAEEVRTVCMEFVTLENMKLGRCAGDTLVRQIRDVVGRKGSLSWIANNVGIYGGHICKNEQQLSAIQRPGWVPSVQVLETNYLKACTELDKGRSEPYYALRHEMFARAFEATIYDGLLAKGRSSPFLVSGTNGEAFPKEEERTQCVAAFSRLLPALSSHLPTIIREEVAAADVTLMAGQETARIAASAPRRPDMPPLLVPQPKSTAVSLAGR